MATGPRTKDTTTVPLGLAQIRLGASAANIDNADIALTSSANSIGALANTKFTSEVDFFALETGYPLLEDATFPLREAAKMECAGHEITPQFIAYAHGLDGSSGYDEAHSGEVALGNITTPEFIRMEAVYTYPDGTNTMNIVFPRAQIASGIELDFQKEEPVASPLVIEAKRADSDVSGGSDHWDNRPLGRIYWHNA